MCEIVYFCPMRVFIFSIFLTAFALFANAQERIPTDTAILKIQQIKNDTLRMDSLYQYARKTVDDHPKKAINASKILLEDANAHNYRKAIANADNIMAEGYEYISNYPQSLKYYLEALRVQKELKLFSPQIFSILGISRIYGVTNDTGNEKKYVEQAMAICQQNKTNEQVRKTLPTVLDYLATVYKKEGQYDTSIKLYKQAITLARKDTNTIELMSSLCNMAIAYKSSKNYVASLAAYNEVIGLIDTVNDVYYFTVITDNMSILFYQMGDIAKAEQYSLRALAMAKKLNNADVLRDIYETLKNIYVKEKRFPEALDYYAKWSDVKDTILNRDKSQQITEWQTKFDDETKDKEIADQKKEIAYNRKINWSLTLSSVLLLSLGLIVYRNYNSQKKYNSLLSKEKKRSEDLLLNILPSEVAEELKDTGKAAVKHFGHVTVIFTDFVNFTQASERMDPQQLIDELHLCFKAFDEIIGKYNVEKIKTIGDSYLAVSGLPIPEPLHAEQVVKAAIEINAFVQKRRQQMGDETFEVRIGIHSGSVVAGIVGVKKFSYDIWGDTVNTAARMEQNSQPGKINISQTTYDLIKDKFTCTYRGEIDAKNKGKLGMYFVEAMS